MPSVTNNFLFIENCIKKYPRHLCLPNFEAMEYKKKLVNSKKINIFIGEAAFFNLSRAIIELMNTLVKTHWQISEQTKKKTLVNCACKGALREGSAEKQTETDRRLYNTL